RHGGICGGRCLCSCAGQQCGAGQRRQVPSGSSSMHRLVLPPRESTTNRLLSLGQVLCAGAATRGGGRIIRDLRQRVAGAVPACELGRRQHPVAVHVQQVEGGKQVGRGQRFIAAHVAVAVLVHIGEVDLRRIGWRRFLRNFLRQRQAGQAREKQQGAKTGVHGDAPVRLGD